MATLRLKANFSFIFILFFLLSIFTACSQLDNRATDNKVTSSSSNGKIEYSCIKLNDESKKKLENYTRENIPWSDDHKIFCDHSTIYYYLDATPEVISWTEDHNGENINLYPTDVGHSDKAFAIKVKTEPDSVPCTNKNRHITLAINTVTGGLAKDSNDIINWSPIQTDLGVLSGTVTNVPFGA